MDAKHYFEIPRFSAILTFIDAIFSEINIGLLIYHVEDREKIASARLIYANKEASRLTGTDLGQLLGKRIFEAFPFLIDTEIPRLYTEVLREKEARRVGIVEYADDHVQPGKYETRAFPMPSDCIGVVFENVALDEA